ncbi:MAG: hypothetical protein M3271_01695 [Actinomycetota bacterium]|nr:hypothetical protein [Actinomycetota bacterium]
MRRGLTILLVLGLVGATMAVPAQAGKKKAKKPVVRVFEVRYENPAFGVGGVGGGCSGCPSIPTLSNETYAVFMIDDDNSPSGYVDLSYDTDGDGIQNLGSGPTVCGSTPEPVAIEAGAAYTAWPWVAGVGCPGSSSTSGTIKAMFSSDPAALEKAMAEG